MKLSSHNDAFFDISIHISTSTHQHPHAWNGMQMHRHNNIINFWFCEIRTPSSVPFRLPLPTLHPLSGKKKKKVARS